ncbi:hypothetical protein FB451DRAFT_1403214 [Mycena latifolia]|nr:hypothetical protein FB451DRAFT_1403214 [Mycena latifolia]
MSGLAGDGEADIIYPPLSLDRLSALKNEPLPTSEALIARPWLVDAEAELVRIDDEIRRLEARKHALIPSVEVYRVALAPHKKLDVDVLREVFTHSVNGWKVDFDKDVFLKRGQKMDMRLVLSHICSHWRSVTVGIHEFWSDVKIIFTEHNTTHRREVLDEWLRRSGEIPLSLDIIHRNLELDDPRITELLA